uniref:Uncharacterized protein n=1 Tax=Aegilops tauschii subsp. strangulata TaxID=200361 RepID=A0A453RS66_AEGTS
MSRLPTERTCQARLNLDIVRHRRRRHRPVDSDGSIELPDLGLGTSMYVTHCTESSSYFGDIAGTPLLVLKR